MKLSRNNAIYPYPEDERARGIDGTESDIVNRLSSTIYTGIQADFALGGINALNYHYVPPFTFLWNTLKRT